MFCAATCQIASALLAAAAFPIGDSAALEAARDIAPLPTIRGEVRGDRILVPTESNPLAEVGGKARVASNAGSFLVTRTSERTFIAVTATCSHEACLIADREDDLYVCQCHGSQFDVNGRVVTGPAELALADFDTRFEEGVLGIAWR